MAESALSLLELKNKERDRAANTNDSGHSFDLAWQGFHEIWMPNTWQGTNLPNRQDLGEGVGQGNGLPRIRSTEVKSRVGGWIFYSSKDHHPLCSQAYTKQEFIFE